MSDNYPEKNIVAKLAQLGEALQGLPPGSYAFPENFPGKKIADAIDKLITIVRETDFGGWEAALAAEAAAREAYDHRQDAKLETLNGHYFPLDGYDFGKSLDVKTPDPDDIALLTTYAMTMEDADDPTGLIDGTVVKNEFDGVEFVWNIATQAWFDWGVGNIVTAGNDHLGVVEGTADPGDGSKDGFVTVLPGGGMETIGFAALKGGLAGETSRAEGVEAEIYAEVAAVQHDVLSRIDLTNDAAGAAQETADGKQPIIAARVGSADSILLAPAAAGGQPGTKALSEFIVNNKNSVYLPNGSAYASLHEYLRGADCPLFGYFQVSSTWGWVDSPWGNSNYWNIFILNKDSSARINIIAMPSGFNANNDPVANYDMGLEIGCDSEAGLLWSRNWLADSLLSDNKAALRVLSATWNGTDYTTLGEYLAARIAATPSNMSKSGKYVSGRYYLNHANFTDLPVNPSASGKRWIIDINITEPLGGIMLWPEQTNGSAMYLGYFSGTSISWRKAATLIPVDFIPVIDGVNFDGSSAITHFGTCSTAAGTAAKVVALAGFSLVAGAEITITFTVTNTAANPTLNVNGSGAKPIYYRNAVISAGYLAANRTYKFVYDGTQYELIGDINVNTTYSVATESANGLMSSTDKTNLNNLVSLADDIDDALDLINGETA
jgi:hypothetical protein